MSGARPPGWRRRDLALSCAAVAAAAAALVFTWLRLFVGMDVHTESWYVLVPWRWVLGDAPFVHERSVLHMPGLLVYPFVKLFGLVTGNDPTGVVLYTRHLYLLLTLGVAVAVFLLLRRLVCWQLALVIAAVNVTYIFWATPQLSYNTMALAFLSLGAALGARVVVLGEGRASAMASGAAYGLAVVAYPTLLFIVAFFAVFFVFAHGRRVVAVVAEGAFDHPPDPPGPPTGITAWRSLSAWVAGGALVLVPVAFILLSFGWRNIKASVRASIVGGRAIQQLGGAPKAIAVARSSWAFVTMHPLVLVAAVAVYLVYRRWPERGRALLVLLPLVLWLGSRDDLLQASGFVGAYMLLAVYLFLFLPRHERDAGAKLLIWVWAPAVLAGAMTAFTSGNGLENAAVGVAPTLMVGGLFLAWALEAAGRPAAARPPDALESAAGDPAASQPGGAEAATDAGGALAAPRPGRLSWLAMAALLAVLALTIVFQFQFQQGGLPYSSLTSRFDSGPWWGIKVTPGQRAQADGFARDLRAQTRPGDELLVFYGGSGYYLYWSGGIASNAYGLMPEGDPAVLPQATFDYFREHQVVPAVVVRLVPPGGLSPAQVATGSGGLGYPATLVRPSYVFYRKPPGESTREVLAGLPRR